MTRAPRIHYFDRAEPGSAALALCGRTPVRWHSTRVRADVTCRACLRELREGPGFAPAELHEDTPPPPFVPHEKVDRSTASRSPAGHPGFLGPLRERVQWRSLDDALVLWATVRRDLYPSKSLTEVLETYASLACRVDGGGAAEPRALRMADRVADIELCMRDAFAPTAWTGAVTAGQAFALVMRRASTKLTLSEIAEGVGVPWSAAHGAVGRARRRLRIEMGARGLIRADGPDVERRRREMEGRRS